MKKALVLLPLLLLYSYTLILSPASAAAPPGTDGGSCCQTGYTYFTGSCINNDIPSRCGNFATSVISNLIAGPCSLPIVGAACQDPVFQDRIVNLTNTASNACTGYIIGLADITTFSANNLCGDILNRIEDPLFNLASQILIFGSTIAQAIVDQINGYQNTCVNLANAAIGALPADPFHVPACNSPLDCNAGICVAPNYALRSPFCDYTNPDSGIRTAIGCIPVQYKDTVSTLLQWAVGLAGGFAFLLLGVASFQLATAGGNPEKVKANKELLYSVLAGIILIALSVVLLNFIGINVLGLGSLGFSL